MPSKRKEIPQAPEDFNRFLELKNVVDSVEDELLVDFTLGLGLRSDARDIQRVH